MTTLPNQPDAVNPAIVLCFAIDGQWRRVTDLERSWIVSLPSFSLA